MADPGSEFRPKDRREARQFEPPPWERDQFEELARQRAEQEAAEKAAQERLQAEIQAAADAETAVQQATAAAGVPAQPAPVAAEQPAGAQAADKAAAGESVAAPSAAETTDGPDEAQVVELLAGLAAEEPSATETIWRTSVIIGGVVVVLGLMFAFWGVRALVTVARTGFVGTLGGLVLLLFGMGSIAGGVYVVVKNLRQRGVL